MPHVRKRIVSGSHVFQGHDPQHTAIEFSDNSPEPKTIILLALNPERFFDYPDAPFLLEVWSLPQYFFFKIFREIEVWHVYLNLL